MARISQDHSHLLQTSGYNHGDGYTTTSWLPSRLSYITLYVHGSTPKRVKPKSVDDLEIVKIADWRLAAEGRVTFLSFGLQTFMLKIVDAP